MHPDLIHHIAREDIAERIRDVDQARRAQLAGSGRGPGMLDQLEASLRRSLGRWQASRVERISALRGDTSADCPCP